MSDLKSRSYSAFSWSFFGLLANQGSTFLVSIFLARILEPKDFGLFAMVTVIISMTQSLTYFGFGESIIQKKESTQLQLSTMFYINVMAGIIMSLAMYFSAPILASFFNQKDLNEPIQALSICFTILSLTLLQNAQLSKRLEFKLITKATVLSSILSGIFGITLAFCGFGIWSLIYKTIAGYILTSLFFWYYSTWIPSFQFSLKAIKSHWNFGYKLYISSIIFTLFNQIDSFFVAKMSSPMDLGLFYRAKSLNNLLLKYSSESLSKVLLPVFSEIQENEQKVLEIVDKSLHTLSFITFGLMGFLYLEGENIIVLLFGEKWQMASEFFNIMIFYAYSYPVSAILGNVIQGLGKSGKFLKMELYKRILTLISIVFGYFFGINIFLWSLVFTTFIQVFISLIFVKKQINIKVTNVLFILCFYFVIAFSFSFIMKYFQSEMQFRRIYEFFLFSFIFTLCYILTNFLIKSKGFNLLLDFVFSFFVKRKRSKLIV